MEELIALVEQWSLVHGLDKEDSKLQKMKLFEEFGNLNAKILQGKIAEVVDSIGELCISLIIYCQQEKINFKNECILLEDLYHYEPENIADIIESIGKAIADVAIWKIILGLDKLAILHYDCSLESCLEIAFNTIKRQKGRVMNGVFVKEQDLQNYL